MNITIKEGQVSFGFDLTEFLDSLTDEEKQEVVEYITWDEVLKQAIQRLIGESDSWQSDDDLLTLEVLTKMEENLLSGYKWSYLSELNKVSRDIAAHEHIYWKMFHDPIHGEFFRQWMKDNKIESNYTGTWETHEQFRQFVETKLTAFSGEQV